MSQVEIPPGYILAEPSYYKKIPVNSRIIYTNKADKRIADKYFKSYQNHELTVGFYISDKRNYTDTEVKQIWYQNSNAPSNPASNASSNPSGVQGGKPPGNSSGNNLRDTIELPPDQWGSLNRDTIISYQKQDGKWVYQVKFNSYVYDKKRSVNKMALTTIRGFSYCANPSSIQKLYRHISTNDKTLTFILQNLKQLETRVAQLEKKIHAV